MHIQQVPGDGQCLYSSLGYHFGLEPNEVRTTLLSHLEARPTFFVDRGFPPFIQEEATRQLLARQEWGGALQIAVAADCWRVQIKVHMVGVEVAQAFLPTEITGTVHILYHALGGHTPNHYDPIIPMGDSDGCIRPRRFVTSQGSDVVAPYVDLDAHPVAEMAMVSKHTHIGKPVVRLAAFVGPKGTEEQCTPMKGDPRADDEGVKTSSIHRKSKVAKSTKVVTVNLGGSIDKFC